MPDPDFSVSDVNLFVGKFLVYQFIHFLSPLPVPAVLGQRWGTPWTSPRFIAGPPSSLYILLQYYWIF